MSQIRTAAKIEVGLHEAHVGFTVEYTDGERAHFLFSHPIATQLAQQLLKLIADLEYVERQLNQMPSDQIGIQDRIQVHLTPPPPEESGPSLSMGVTD